MTNSPSPLIIMGRDRSHVPEIIKALKRLRAACHSIGLSGPKCPVDVLVPEDGLLDAMPALMLEQALVLCTWPGTDVRIGSGSATVLIGDGVKGQKVLYFKDRDHVIKFALETVTQVATAMEKGKGPNEPAHDGEPGGGKPKEVE